MSTSLMERIVAFGQKTGRNVDLSFVNSRVHIAIHHQKDLFEPKLFTSLYNQQSIREYFNDLSLALGIAEDLALNTRIWSKTASAL